MISVIIVFRNEEKYIVNCIKSIEQQFNDKDKWELLLIDGKSTDKSILVAQKYLKKANINFRIIVNEKKILASGWNIGIKEAKGNYVIRPDAHATLHKNYIKEGIKTLEDMPEVTAVGGILETKANGFWGNIIKVALSSKVGVGNSSFRTATKSGFADTAVFAVYRKSIFEKVGYFNEKLVRHQDNDMHKRIKDAGGKFFLNINMKADYYCRDTIPKLLKQMFNIGKYLPMLFGKSSFSIRHLIPFLFISSLLILLFLGQLFNPMMFFAATIYLFYLLIVFIDSLINSIKTKNIFVLLNIFIIPLMHLSYGLGTIFGFFKIGFSKIKLGV